MDPGTLLLGAHDPGDIDTSQMFRSLAATFVLISSRHGRYRSGNNDHSDQYHSSASRLLVQSIFNQFFCRSIIPRSWTQQKLFWLRSEQDAAKNWERTRKNRNCKKYKKDTGREFRLFPWPTSPWLSSFQVLLQAKISFTCSGFFRFWCYQMVSRLDMVV